MLTTLHTSNDALMKQDPGEFWNHAWLLFAFVAPPLSSVASIAAIVMTIVRESKRFYIPSRLHSASMDFSQTPYRVVMIIITMIIIP